MLAMMMVAAVSVCFMSCRGDDDSETSIIGTWKYTFGDGYVLLTFNSDGTVLYQEYDNGKWEEEGETMTYTYNKGILSFYSYGKTKPETATVVSLTSTKLVLKDWPDKGNCTFMKQQTSSLIGTWKYTFGDGYVLLTFNTNGTVLYQEYDNGKWEEEGETMTYTYSNNILSFYSYGKTNPETATVVSLTSTKLVLKDWPDGGNCTFYKQ